MKTKIFGCKTNKYFSEKWESHPSMLGAEGIFVASCVVTDQAKAKWVKFVKRSIAQLAGNEKIYLTGCGAIRGGKIDEAFYEQYSELIPFRDKIVLLWEDPEDADARANVPTSKEAMASKIAAFKQRATNEKLYTRKHLVIQTGCDNFCTFCLTLQARWRHKSRDMDSILEEIREYEAGGGKEVVLTGTNLGAWGAQSSNDFNASRLVELIDRILAETSIPRLRISSLWVEFVSDELLARFATKRVHAYAHLSVQSWSDSILRAMNRHYDRKRLLDRLERLANLGREDGVRIQIWADLIVGFPGETESDFADTLSLVEKHGISQLHAFPFSAHVDKYHVPAGSFPNQVPERTKLDRLDVLMRAGDAAKDRFLAQSDGTAFEVLLEGNPKNSEFRGWSENYVDCDQSNFIPDTGSQFVRGTVVKGKYRYAKLAK